MLRLLTSLSNSSTVALLLEVRRFCIRRSIGQRVTSALGRGQHRSDVRPERRHHDDRRRAVDSARVKRHVLDVQ